MPLPYEFNGACSIELFRPEDRGLEPQQAGCHSLGCSLKYLTPILKWIGVEQVADLLVPHRS